MPFCGAKARQRKEVCVKVNWFALSKRHASPQPGPEKAPCSTRYDLKGFNSRRASNAALSLFREPSTREFSRGRVHQLNRFSGLLRPLLLCPVDRPRCRPRGLFAFSKTSAGEIKPPHQGLKPDEVIVPHQRFFRVQPARETLNDTGTAGHNKIFRCRGNTADIGKRDTTGV